MGEGIEPGEDDPVAAGEGVVGEYGGNRNREPEGGHDERLAHRAGHVVDGRLAALSDAEEGVVDGPDGAEEPDERCGAAH